MAIVSAAIVVIVVMASILMLVFVSNVLLVALPATCFCDPSDDLFEFPASSQSHRTGRSTGSRCPPGPTFVSLGCRRGTSSVWSFLGRFKVCETSRSRLRRAAWN